MYTDEDLLIASAAVIILEDEKKRRRKRRFWVRPSLRNRAHCGIRDFMKDLLLDNIDELNLEYRSRCDFRNFFRMGSSDFETLLNLIAPTIKKEDTTFRRAISADERLAVTLRFLVTGDSYHSLSYMFKMSKQTISKIIPDVCNAIVSALRDYIKTPQSETEWKTIAKKLNDRWNFPNCVGTFDGKHINLQAPIHSGTEYFNNKKLFSIILFAVVDANYNFIYANVGCQERITDGDLLTETEFHKCLQDNTLHLPPPCALPGRSSTTPFVFVADDAIPLSRNIMTPFPGTQLNGSKQRIFNYRLNRARKASENTFGIISSTYHILRKSMLLEPERAKKVVLAVLYLHNFLRKGNSRAIYNPPGTFDYDCLTTGEINPGIWRRSPSNEALVNIPRISRRGTDESQAIRNEFADFFISPDGIVPFQNDK